MSSVNSNNSYQEGTIPSLILRIGHVDCFNYALFQKGIMPIRDIQLKNTTKDTIENAIVQVHSDNDIIKDSKIYIRPIPAGKPVKATNLRIDVDTQKLLELTEAIKVNLEIRAVVSGEIVDTARQTIEILAYDEWPGLSHRELLASFVMPNHPTVVRIKRRAADYLKMWGKSPSLEGYQCYNNPKCDAPNRIRDFAAAVYAAIQEENLVYANPPSSFNVGQRIRTPDAVFDQGMGTCMDMTMLYASVLDSISLNPILVIIEGHIFAGVWLADKTFDEIVTVNPQELTARMGSSSSEITLIECTSMCAGMDRDFEDAEYIGQKNLEDFSKFEFAIDVRNARKKGFNPIPSRVIKDGVFVIDRDPLPVEEVTKAPNVLNINIKDVQKISDRQITKRDYWESKLLDLSQRNLLLYIKQSDSILPILSSDVSELTDVVMDGGKFNIFGLPPEISGIKMMIENEKGEEESIRWVDLAINNVGILEMTDWRAGKYDNNSWLDSEYRSHRIYTYDSQKGLEKRLTALYRKARNAEQENGVSGLFLAVGLLRWFDNEALQEEKKKSKKKKKENAANMPNYSPLILIPVELNRLSANQGYSLYLRDDEPRFNTTLAEMLRQNFNIEIPGVDSVLEEDGKVDAAQVFASVRSAVISQWGWDVVETCLLGHFDFATFTMWNDIHNSDGLLENNKVVRSMMNGYVDFDTTIEESGDENIYLPITVDDTQLGAIKAASGGTTFVLHGPPGTGKSQTITAMIANLMAQGKTVLFVAEKMAALSVVQKRLAELGIGEFCIEVFGKADKKHVMAQIERAIAVGRKHDKTKYEKQLRNMEEKRAELDSYRQSLHLPRKCGYSVKELIDMYESVGHTEEFIYFDLEKLIDLTGAEVREHKSSMELLFDAGRNIGIDRIPKLNNIRRTELTAEIRLELRPAIRKYKDNLEELKGSCEELKELLGVNNIPNEIGALLLALEEIKSIINGDVEVGYSDALLATDPDKMYDFFKSREDADKIKKDLLEKWDERYLYEDPVCLRRQYEEASRKLFKTTALEKMLSSISAFSRNAMTIGDIPAAIDQLKSYRDAERKVEQLYSSLSEEEQKEVNRYETWEEYQTDYTLSTELQNKSGQILGGINTVSVLADPNNRKRFYSCYDKTIYVKQIQDQINNMIDRDSTASSIDDELLFCTEVISDNSMIKDWISYNRNRTRCISIGLEPVVHAFEEGMREEDIKDAYKRGLSYHLINMIVGEDPVLNEFSGSTFDRKVAQFRELDAELIELTKKEIRSLLISRLPSDKDSPEVRMEMTFLHKAIKTSSKGLTIRSIFSQTPHVIQRLCPCMLMSPNSVAQYLEQKNDLFDVVIFDEASQLPTYKAIGSLARAKNAIIVGDPKQMPPTNFFGGESPQEIDIRIDDLDSILEDALALEIPSRYLQWHYRSQHESLIAFSNSEFYNSSMYTFPSSNDRERRVNYEYVDGRFINNTNVKEAEAIVEDIIRRYHDPELRKLSIGVVTFNVKQRDLIENMLTKQFKNDPELDKWANNSEEALFIKNLENVQGDERDVILFSVGYGKNEKGQPSMNFGPINNVGGGKRLNVAFSRARYSMTIFTCLHYYDIKTKNDTSEGVTSLRNFLRFAEGGELTESVSKHSQNGKEGLLESITSIISDNGYQYDTLVGHSNFHVDIAVIDPYNPEHYMLGILLDGDGYKSTENTRDREIAQTGVLSNLKWNLHRIWSLDWWDNHEKVERNLLALLERVRSEAEIEAKRKQERDKEKEESSVDIDALRKELELQAEEAVAEEAEESKEESPLIVETEKVLEKEPKATAVAENKIDASDSREGDQRTDTDKDNATDVETAGTVSPVTQEKSEESDNVEKPGKTDKDEPINVAPRKPVEHIKVADMPIGKYVQYCVAKLAEEDMLDDTMIANLLDSAWSKQMFGLGKGLAFFVEKGSGVSTKDSSGRNRYYKDIYSIRDRKFYLCSQWYKEQRSKFDAWLDQINDEQKRIQSLGDEKVPSSDDAVQNSGANSESPNNKAIPEHKKEKNEVKKPVESGEENVNNLPIGKYVQHWVGKLTEENLLDDKMISNLVDKDWSHKTFGLGKDFAFFVEKGSGVPIKDRKGHIRYYKDAYTIRDREFYLCSQWYKGQRTKFDAWLEQVKKNRK